MKELISRTFGTAESMVLHAHNHVADNEGDIYGGTIDTKVEIAFCYDHATILLTNVDRVCVRRKELDKCLLADN